MVKLRHRKPPATAFFLFRQRVRTSVDVSVAEDLVRQKLLELDAVEVPAIDTDTDEGTPPPAKRVCRAVDRFDRSEHSMPMTRPLPSPPLPSPPPPSPPPPVATPLLGDAPASSKLDGVAAHMSPAAMVQRLAGSELQAPTAAAAFGLLERNMRPLCGESWDSEEKRATLADGETRLLLIRSGAPGAALLGFAAWQLITEATVLVAYLLEVQVEPAARGHQLGSELVREVERAGRSAGARGLMLTVHVANATARRLYAGPLHFEVSPISPTVCAPPSLATSEGYEIMQRMWNEAAKRTLQEQGDRAKRLLHKHAIADGSLTVPCRRAGDSSRATGVRTGGLRASPPLVVEACPAGMPESPPRDLIDDGNGYFCEIHSAPFAVHANCPYVTLHGCVEGDVKNYMFMVRPTTPTTARRAAPPPAPRPPRFSPTAH